MVFITGGQQKKPFHLIFAGGGQGGQGGWQAGHTGAETFLSFLQFLEKAEVAGHLGCGHGGDVCLSLARATMKGRGGGGSWAIYERRIESRGEKREVQVVQMVGWRGLTER